MRASLPLIGALGAALCLTSPAAAQAPADSNMARALRVLRAAPVMDGHNDLPWRIREDSVHPSDVDAYDLRKRTPGMTDLARLKAGHVGAQFWSIYIPGEPTDAVYKSKGAVSSKPGYARVQLEQIDIARRVIAKYPELAWTPTATQVSGDGQREDRVAPRPRGRPRDRELAGATAPLLRVGRALHDAHAQRDARLGRRRARQRQASRPHAVRPGSRARDEPARHARRSVARVAGDDERRARRDGGAGHLLALGLARARRPSPQRARLDPRAHAEERRRRHGPVRELVRVGRGQGRRRRARGGDRRRDKTPSARQRRP